MKVDEIRKDINLLSKIRDINNIVSIKEVREEVQKGINIFNEQLNFIIFGKKVSRRNKGRIKRYNGSFDIINEECSNLQTIREYITSLYKTIRKLNKFIDQLFYFDEPERNIYIKTLKTLDEKTRDELDLNNPCNSFGDRLDTDNKLIATSIAFSFNSPVIVLTRDMGLQRKLRQIQNQNQTQNQRHEVHSMGANTFFMPRILETLRTFSS